MYTNMPRESRVANQRQYDEGYHIANEQIAGNGIPYTEGSYLIYVSNKPRYRPSPYWLMGFHKAIREAKEK